MKRPLAIFCLGLICVYFALYLCGIFSPYKLPNNLNFERNDDICISGKIYKKENNLLYLSDTSIFPKKNMLILVDFQDTQKLPGIGQYVEIEGKYEEFSEATNPGEFDFKKYYNAKNIYARLKKAKLLSANGNANFVYEGLFQLRYMLEKKLYNVYPQKEASILCNLLFGDKGEIDDDIKALYQRHGIAHILSISGLHIGIVGMGLYSLLKKLSKNPLPSAIVSFIFILLYGIMTGMSVSTIRAISMFSIKLLSDVLGRTFDTITTTSVVALIMVISEPRNLGSSGFLLSFFAVLGVSCFAPALIHLAKQILSDNHVIRKLISKLVIALLSSLSITLTTLPIQLHFYYEVPIFSVFLNMIILPLMSVLVISGLISVIIPGASFLRLIPMLILGLYEKLLQKTDELPVYSWNPGCPKAYQIVIYYLIWIIIILLSYKYEEILELIKSRVTCVIDLKGFKFFITIVLSIAMVYIISIPRLHNTTLIFLDVGQGDGIILHTNNGDNYLFDGGSSTKSKVGENVIKPALKYYGLSNITAIFVSHPDKDHCSGVIELLENHKKWQLNISSLILSDCKMPEDNSNYQKLLENSPSLKYIHRSNSLKSGDTSIVCLSPQSGYNAADMNEFSEVFLIEIEKLCYPAPQVMLTGDVQGEAEKALLDYIKRNSLINNQTILKVSHHGSNYSSPEVFLTAVHPALSIISVGEDNSYGHPGKETLSRLDEVGSKILRTDKSGAIIISFGNRKVSITTNNTNF